jgi:hypothetical protein
VTYRYNIRTFTSRDGDGNLAAQTIVLPTDTSFSLNAASIDDVERMLCENVTKGTLAAGRVYQICPLVGNSEAIRSVAICEKAKARPVTLDATLGMYSVFRAIRCVEEVAAAKELPFRSEAVQA